MGITNQSELAKLVIHHNGPSASSFSKLTADLKAAAWIENYRTPLGLFDLNEEGYKRIADLKMNGEMGRFVRLLVGARGGTVKDPSALATFLPAFSGKVNTQSFALLSQALEEAPFV